MAILRARIQNLFQRRGFASTAIGLQQQKLTLPRLPIFEALASHPKDDTAVVHSASGRSFSYGNLLADTALYKEQLLKLTGSEKQQNLEEKRVAMLVENGYDYVVSMLGIFASGGIAVPLCTSHPTNEMRYVVTNSTPSLLVTSTKFQKQCEAIFDSSSSSSTDHVCSIDCPHKRLPHEGTDVPPVELTDNAGLVDRGALIIYTSGTTNLPKGVVSTHKALAAQSSCIIQEWMMHKDHLLHVLPLHHIHGVVNGTLAPLFSGGTIEYMFPFNAAGVWERFAAGVSVDAKVKKPGVSLFMAVPTVYNRLLSAFSGLPEDTKEKGREAVGKLRLAISGSAALPGSIKDQWRALAGTELGGGTILERYGMTEIGMALSQKLALDCRMSNSVGWPLPGVEARLVDIESGSIIQDTEKEGEIQIRGDTVFREYWGKPEATAKEFVEDEAGRKWFKTGDIAIRDNRGAYFIRGRASVDIIKSGGEKISALEVERELLELPQVKEAAVVALSDAVWGQKVAAVVVLTPKGKEEKFGRKEMRESLKKNLARYKVPSIMKVVDEIRRNQMGKINKKILVKEIFSE
ncbi:uncharacterized protein H6S33_011755 [Morchella sextelata]|uniref:uncharacterized protein n=1 Tax=Morchella sextelata TaxID=1174677 RepID=UPI001D03F1F0|nr:uncharacterized protein H6S33_011755 [Morchella sextelata]KAH0610228.1 hypothetical protein H6S33_011755 [Morchella sextelata]